MRGVKLWDLPVRICHWAFVLLLPALWWTAEKRDIDLHVKLGLVMLGLVVFRLVWGLVGSSSARFASFIRGPVAVLGYLKGLKGGHSPSAGHNPAGGWSVLALLTLLAAQVTIGLFTQDVDATHSGPLNYLVTYDTGDGLRHWHEWGFNLILAFVVLHLAAIAYYVIAKKDNIVRPMITGSRAFPQGVAAPRIAPLWRALAVGVLAALLAVWVGIGAPTSKAAYEASKQAPPAEDYM